MFNAHIECRLNFCPEGHIIEVFFQSNADCHVSCSRYPSHSALIVLYTHMITYHNRVPRVDVRHMIHTRASKATGSARGSAPLAIGGECKGGAGPPFAKTSNHVFPGSVFSGAIYWVAAPQFIRNRMLCNTCKCYITFCYVTAKKVLRNSPRVLRNRKCYVTAKVLRNRGVESEMLQLLVPSAPVKNPAPKAEI